MKSGHDRDRDQTFDTALKQAFAVRADEPASASEACLDAETLAAWIDEGLDPSAVIRAEAHVSSCARCQALVGQMARIAPEVPVGGAARSSFWRWWLAPVAAAAAATLVWMVVPNERYTAPPPAPAAEVAQAPSDRFVNEPQPPAPPPAPPSTPPPAAAVSPRPSEDDAPRREAPAARSAMPTTDAQEQRAAPAQSRAFSADLTVARDVSSPDPAVRWRIRSGGVVEYTPDAGRTWERVTTGVTTEIVAGSSPAPQVCWLVGQGGLVLVSQDGRTFARVSTPVDADLVGVQASDALTAVVTAGDGRVFHTDDGGRTWRPRE